MLSIPENKTDSNNTSAVSVRAAIIGASCRLPGARNLEEFWALIQSGRHGLRNSPPGRYEALELPQKYIESLEKTGHQWGGYLDGIDMFDPVVFGMSRIEASTSDPQHRLVLEVAWEALENACLAPKALAGSRTGVFVGMSGFDYSMFLGAFDPYGTLVTPFSTSGTVHSIAANRISYLLDLHGPSLAIDAACSSSSHALHMALRSLEQGECDSAIVCGANIIMCPYPTQGFKRARMLSKDGLVKSFDEKTDGYVRAEGAVAIVIRREDMAVERGNRIMGVLSGSAVNHDGRTAGLFSPSRERQIELISSAQAAAGVDQSDIGFVEAHGTGTFRGDETELNALNSVFTGSRDANEGDGPCYVASVKSNVGHLESVSGLAGVLKSVLCLEKGEIPGQANLTKPMPAANADGARVVVPAQNVAWPRSDVPRRAGVSCLGFGGANSHFVIEEGPLPGVIAHGSDGFDDRPVQVLKLSAKTQEQIEQVAGRLGDDLAGRPELSLGDICHSLNFGRADFDERVGMACRSRNELAASLAELAQGREGDSLERGRAKRGGYKIALSLPGTDSACRGLGRGLYDSEPRFRVTVEGADAVVRAVAGVSLVDAMYGGSSDLDGTPIDDPVLARAAAFATQCALARLLVSIGIEPASIVGDGVGEIVARVLNSRISFDDGVKAALSGVVGDAGKSSLCGALSEGADLVIEVGGGKTSLDIERVKSGAGDVVSVSFLSRGEDACVQWARGVAKLYTLGVDIDWQAFDAPFVHKRLALPTYCFARERFWFTDDGPAPGTLFAQEAIVAQNDAQSKTHAAAGGNNAVSVAPVSNGADAVALPVAAAVIDRRELFEFVAESVAAATSVPVDEIGEDTRFENVEMDSIAGLELLLRLDKKLGAMPDPEMFAEDMTFGAAIDSLHDLAKTAAERRSKGQSSNGANGSLNGGAPAATQIPAQVSPQLNGLNGSLNGHALNGADDGAVGRTQSQAHTQVLAFLDEIKTQIDPTDYLKSVRPDFTTALHEMLLDVDFDTALGDRVSGTRFGVPVNAIDMLGGFGSTLFGHNHPALVGVMRELLEANRPAFVQMSNRSAAGALAKELIARVAKDTGRDYRAVLGSTGAEMVDAALKHALFEWSGRRQTFVSACRGGRDGVPVIANKPPVVLAIEGSFHGKTLGAYSLTWHAPGRDELGLSGPFDVVWLPRDDERAAEEIFARYMCKVSNGDRRAEFSRIAGLFLEPIQGEGGMFPLAKSYAAVLRRLADEAGCPIVVDEIQSGMGRAGAFSAASLIDLRGDYYLFGKSLGGGLTKTSALLIDSERYAQGYGFAHTSTFGEDDHSAFVGLRALRLLDEDDVCGRAVKAGGYLVECLQDVMARYPGVLVDVRGCGLMIGIELGCQRENSSQMISGLSDQKLLGIFVASHLLHRRGVRVGTALSRPSTLRFEPSAYVSRADMDHTVAGIEAVCRIIAEGDAADLVRHLAQGFRLEGQTPFKMGDDQPGAVETGSEATSVAPVLAGNQAVFLGHMIDSNDIGILDKSLLTLTVEERESLAARLVDPVLIKRVDMETSCGEKLNFELHTLPLTSRAIVNALREGQTERIVEQVNTAVEQFAESGARVVGLGGLLSVITRNGLAVRNEFDGLQITTGNTYTVALAAEAVLRTARDLKLDPACESVGIIGAGGNIGSTLVQILGESFHRLRLVGRKASIARVERAADAAYDAALINLRSGGMSATRGLAAAIGDSKLVSTLEGVRDGMNGGGNGAGPSAGARLRAMIIERYGEDPFLPVCEDISALGDCSIIVTASNSIAPILNTDNVGPATRIICDVSVPSDVCPELSHTRPEITVIRGGIARAPRNNQFTFDMIKLPENHMLACMTETALLGFSGEQGFSGIGDIRASGVRECHELGLKYGFELGYSSVEKPFAVDLGE